MDLTKLFKQKVPLIRICCTSRDYAHKYATSSVYIVLIGGQSRYIDLKTKGELEARGARFKMGGSAPCEVCQSRVSYENILRAALSFRMEISLNAADRRAQQT